MSGGILYRIIFLFLFLLVLGIRIFFAKKAKTPFSRGLSINRWRKAAVTEGGSRTLLWAISFVFIYLAMILYLLDLPFLWWSQLLLPEWSRWVGVSLCILSIPFLIWIHQTLGRYWRTSLEFREGHLLVKTGPYKRVRHPMYSVLITFNLGLILISADFLVTMGFLIIIILTLIRIPKEEQMMLEKFGSEYRDYMDRTRRLFPRLRLKDKDNSIPSFENTS